MQNRSRLTHLRAEGPTADRVGNLALVDRAGATPRSRIIQRETRTFGGTRTVPRNVALVSVSSGRTDRYRMNRGGNRQLNHAIHMLALSRICHEGTGVWRQLSGGGVRPAREAGGRSSRSRVAALLHVRDDAESAHIFGVRILELDREADACAEP